MALPTQQVEVQFTSGMDRKVDDKLKVKLDLLQNGQFVDANTIRKRAGLATSSYTVPASSQLESSGEYLLAISPSGIRAAATGALGTRSLGVRPFGFAPELKRVIEAGSTSTPSYSAVNSTGSQVLFTYNGNTCIFSEPGLGLLFSEIDQSRDIIGVAVSGTNFVLFSSDGTNLFYKTISQTTFAASSWTSIASTSDFSTGGADGSNRCVIETSAGILIATNNDTTSNSIRAVLLNSSTLAVLSGPVSISTTGNVEDVTCNRFSGGRFGFFTREGTNVRCYTTTSSLGSPTSALLIQSSASDVELCGTFIDGSDLSVYYGADTAGATPEVRKATVTSTPTVATASFVVQEYVRPVSRPFVVNGRPHIACAAIQDDSITKDFSGVILVLQDPATQLGPTGAKLAPVSRLAEEVASESIIRTVPAVSSSGVYFGIQTRRNLVYGAVKLGDSLVELAKLNLTARISVSKQLSPMVSGGVPFDLFPDAIGNSRNVEHGFLTRPVVFTLTAAGSGALPAGTYQVCYLYKYKSPEGVVYRSPPSVPRSITVTLNQKIQVAVRPPAAMAAEFANGNQVTIEVYATDTGGTIFYRSASLSTEIGVGSTIEVNTSGATLTGNEILYTQSGELDDDPCPGHLTSWLHQQRIFVCGLEDPQVVRFSKEQRLGVASGFPLTFRVEIPTDFGRPVGGCSMDDRCVIFTDKGICYLSGQGPTVAGLGGYSNPEFIPNSVGALPGSGHVIKVTGQGAWYQSAQGIRLLSRGLGLARNDNGTFVGSEVDSLIPAGQVILSSMTLENKNQVRFTLPSDTLVFDYHFSQWSLFKYASLTLFDAAEWDGGVAVVLSNGALYTESGTTDAGTDFAMQVITAWLKLNTLYGLQRIRKLGVVGQALAASSMKVEVSQDYSPSYDEANAKTFAFTGVGAIVSRYDMPRQKCVSLRVKITETSSSGLGFSLSGLVLDAGVKRGMGPVTPTPDPGEL